MTNTTEPPIQMTNTAGPPIQMHPEDWEKEFIELERMFLLTRPEIEVYINTRREFESRLVTSQEKPLFERYIEFDLDLMILIRQRKERLGLTTEVAEVEHLITTRVAKLYQQVVLKFRDDVKLWLHYFQFCADYHFNGPVSQMLVIMLNHHTDKEFLFIHAAKVEFEQIKSIENARNMLQLGIKHNSKSKLLYSQTVQLELEYFERLRIERGISNNTQLNVPELSTARAQSCYKAALSKFFDIEFIINMLKMAAAFPDTSQLQREILSDMMSIHPDEVLTWDTMAKQEYEGSSCQSEVKQEEIVIIDETEESALKYRIQKSVNVYKIAVKKQNVPEMWNCYLEHVLHIHDCKSTSPAFSTFILTKAMNGAVNSGQMTEKYYIRWLDILKENKKHLKMKNVLESATNVHPGSFILWERRLLYLLRRDLGTEAMTVFKSATEKLTQFPPIMILDLWKYMLQYFQMKAPGNIKSIYEDGIKLKNEVSQLLKPLYISWLVTTEGIGSARLVFHQPDMQDPPCLGLLQKMTLLETTQPDISLKAIRKCHDFTCKHFGKENNKIWMEYVLFELRFGETNRAAHVYNLAMRNLEPHLKSEFKKEYDAFHAKI